MACEPYFFDSSARLDDSVPMYFDDPIGSIDDEQFTFSDHNRRTSWPSLKSCRQKYLDGLIKSLDKYYADENLEDFEILNPKTITVDLGRNKLNFPANANYKHRQLAERLKINSPNLGVQLHNLFESVAVEVEYETFKEWTKLPAEVFSNKILQKQAASTLIEISPELLQYISSALTVPVGSSDAERGFSILFHSLDKRRTCLSVETIDALLTIRINGPPLKHFDCQKYLIDWKAGGHLESDAQPPRGPDNPRYGAEDEEDDPIHARLVYNEYMKEMWEKRDTIFIKKPIET